jgi:serine/threonine protein kinase
VTSASDPESWLGRTLGGRYRIVAVIAEGGMGVAYRAWDQVADQYRVVKMPRAERTAVPGFVERFARELAVLRHLSHPAVVPIHDVGEEQGTPFAVMPYLAGGSLKRRQWMRRGRPVPTEPVSLRSWLTAIAGAIDFVHARGFVHRDVKPDNILFDGAGNAFLGDFGVVKVVMQAEDEQHAKELTTTGLALGTPAYMAPELIEGSAASALSDQYSLAVTAYELLAGQKPFDGPTPAAVIVAVAAAKPAPLQSLRQDLPESTAAAVMRGLSKDPAQRFESCQRFAEAVLEELPSDQEAHKRHLMCPRCGRLLKVKGAWAGKRGSCPKCDGALSISADALTLWLPEDRSGSVSLTPPNVDIGRLGHTPSSGFELPQSLRQWLWQGLRRSVVGQALLAAAFLLAIIVGLVWPSRKSDPPITPPDSEPETAPAVIVESQGDQVRNGVP